MKKFFLISMTIIISVSMVLIGAGCKTAAQPTVPEFNGGDFEITLPENWEGAKKEELDSVIENLNKAGLSKLADVVDANRDYLVFFGYDAEVIEENGNVNIFTITGESKVVLSLQEYMDISYESVAEQYEKAKYTFNIVEQEIVALGDNEEVGRTIFEQTVESNETKVAQYIIKNGSDFWILTFSTDLEQFDENLQDFDAAIETFKILD
ncbi:MAG TPA: hypothetical protein VIH07_03570 [Candidatus Humimicrobiaceae bacterium]|nr:MAG: hypothetical protein A2V94_06955 [Candidatus Atribacteria bacterium RBG_16_35_8]